MYIIILLDMSSSLHVPLLFLIQFLKMKDSIRLEPNTFLVSHQPYLTNLSYSLKSEEIADFNVNDTLGIINMYHYGVEGGNRMVYYIHNYMEAHMYLYIRVVQC